MPAGNEVEKERQAKLNMLLQIRQEAMEVQDRLMSSDIEVVRMAEKDLERLLEQFYDENQNMMAPQQYEAAKKDFGYFVTLIEMAIGYFEPQVQDLERQTLH
jgi:hypothetical protein